MDETVSQEVARLLLTSGAVGLSTDQPSPYADGTSGPMWLDGRALLCRPSVRDRLAELLSGLVRDSIAQGEVITGTGADGMSLLVADRLGLPFVTALDPRRHLQPTPYGLMPGQRLVMVGSLEPIGSNILGAVMAFNKLVRLYGVQLATILGPLSVPARQLLERCDIDLGHSLTTYSTVVEMAVGLELLPPGSLEWMLAWPEDPQAWEQQTREGRSA